MTRKRFIKLVMSHGVSRNKAQEMARAFNSKNLPYEKAYRCFMLTYGVRKGFRELSMATSNFAARVRKTMAAFVRLSEAIKAANEEVEG